MVAGRPKRLPITLEMESGAPNGLPIALEMELRPRNGLPITLEMEFAPPNGLPIALEMEFPSEMAFQSRWKWNLVDQLPFPTFLGKLTKTHAYNPHSSCKARNSASVMLFFSDLS